MSASPHHDGDRYVGPLGLAIVGTICLACGLGCGGLLALADADVARWPTVRTVLWAFVATVLAAVVYVLRHTRRRFEGREGAARAALRDLADRLESETAARQANKSAAAPSLDSRPALTSPRARVEPPSAPPET